MQPPDDDADDGVLALFAENQIAREGSRLTEILAGLLKGEDVRELIAHERRWASKVPGDALLSALRAQPWELLSRCGALPTKGDARGGASTAEMFRGDLHGATDAQTGEINRHVVAALRRQYVLEILPHLATLTRMQLPTEYRAPSAVVTYSMLYPNSFVALAQRRA